LQLNTSTREAFDRQGAPSWFRSNQQIQTFGLSETMRFGDTGVRVLQTMFPGRHDSLTSGVPAGKDTPYIPVIFNPLRDWWFDKASQEVVASKTFFAHVAPLVAHEVITLLCGGVAKRRKGILIISFFKRFLQGMQDCLRHALPKLCRDIWKNLCLGSPSDPDLRNLGKECQFFDFEFLVSKGVLAFSAALRSGGGDCAVAFLCVPQRQRGDISWVGDAIQRHLIFFGLSRASDAVYICMEDLSSRVVLPNGDTSATQEGIRLGIRNTNWFRDCLTPEQVWEEQAMFTRRLPWLRFLDMAGDLWQDLGVPVHRQFRLESGATIPLPLADSPMLQGQVLGLSLALAHDLVRAAAALYDYVCWSAGVKAMADSEVSAANTVWDWRFWSTALRENFDCSTQVDQIKWERDVVKIYGGVDADIGFDTSEALDRWPEVAINCLCVHVISDKEFNIALPVAPALRFPRGAYEWREEDDVNFLIREVAERAYQVFCTSDTYEAVKNQGGTAHFHVGQHKKEEVQLGSDMAVLKTENSDRPYFATMVQDPPVEKDDTPHMQEWSHAYRAMGLAHQHKAQDTILCRVYNLELAACHVHVAQEMLGIDIHERLITAGDSDAAQDARVQLLAKLWKRCPEVLPHEESDQLQRALDRLEACSDAVRAAAEGDTRALKNLVCF